MSVLIASIIGSGVVVLLAHELERIGLRRLDADEHGEELRLAHQREDFRLLGDVERRLAGEAASDSRAASARR